MEINEIQVREEIMWNQRSRVLWLKWGGRNTKFFHAMVSQRRRKIWIAGLQNSEGVWVEDKEGIKSTILDYFKDIYCHTSNSIPEFVTMTSMLISSLT